MSWPAPASCGNPKYLTDDPKLGFACLARPQNSLSNTTGSSSHSMASSSTDLLDAVPTSQLRSSLAAVFSPVNNVYSRFSQWRTSLGLPNPGTSENVQKEVKSTCLKLLLSE